MFFLAPYIDRLHALVDLVGIFFEFIADISFSILCCIRFGRDWKKIEAFIGSKTVIQV